jgi:hypothetical protein
MALPSYQVRVYGLMRAAYRLRYRGQPPSLSTPS